MSLTVGYIPNYVPGTAISTLADIDGENPAVNAVNTDSYSIVSLADTVFASWTPWNASPNNYVTLVVNVTPSSKRPLPQALAFNARPLPLGNYTITSVPINQGASPVQPLANHLEQPQPPLPYYTAWVNTTTGGTTASDPYVVLDLTQFGDFYTVTGSGAYSIQGELLLQQPANPHPSKHHARGQLYVIGVQCALLDRRIYQLGRQRRRFHGALCAAAGLCSRGEL